jgi:hypothetical protein
VGDRNTGVVSLQVQQSLNLEIDKRRVFDRACDLEDILLAICCTHAEILVALADKWCELSVDSPMVCEKLD